MSLINKAQFNNFEKNIFLTFNTITMGFFKSLTKGLASVVGGELGDIAGDAVGDIAGDAVSDAIGDKASETISDAASSYAKDAANKATSKATEKAVDHVADELTTEFSQTPQQAQQMPPTPQQQMQPMPQQQMPPMPQQQMPPMPQQQNNGQMYNAKIENLINAALADGELTEKEKQILYKNAQMSGIDLDEFEMVLEAKLFEKKQEMQTKAQAQAAANAQIQQTAAPKSTKYGDVNKCPSCGAMIETFSTHCPQCGFEFSGIEASASFTKLMRELDAAEATRKAQGMKEMMFGQLGDPVTNRKKAIISNFPIPTTKADILEFTTMAAPLAQKKGSFFTANHPDNKAHNDLVGAWQDKLKQIVIKARLSMKEDKQTIAEIEKIVRESGIKI